MKLGGSIGLCGENEFSMLFISHLILGIIIVSFFNLNWYFYNRSMTIFLSHHSWPGLFTNLTGFPRGSVRTESACNAGDLGSIPGLGRSPGEGNGNPLQYSCLEYPMDWRSLVGYSPQVAKSRTRLKEFTFTMGPMGFPGGSDGKKSACNSRDLGWSLGWEEPLEKEMATHSSILAWSIPWTEEPGRLQSMGSQELDTTEWLNTFFSMME